MRIVGLTVSVDYADFLEQSLPRWSRGLDDLLVVTTARDAATREVCRREQVRTYETDVFYRDGASFNKAGALDEGVAVLNPTSWLLLIDADVVPPVDWRATIDRVGLKFGRMYGVRRVFTDGTPVLDHEWQVAGYFQLFHIDDPAARERPLFGHWSNASGYDTVFSRRWETACWRTLPFTVTHLGAIAENWCGRGNTQGMRRMQALRQRLKTWNHERLGR